MREIDVKSIKEAVSRLCLEANTILNDDLLLKFHEVKETEGALGRDIFDKMIENAEYAKSENLPICQDTGMAVVYIYLGQDVHIINGFIEDAVNEGVADGYTNGFLRASVVKDPISRINTKANTPAVVHYKLVPGDALRIVVAPKGFGSENMSALKMLKPSDGLDGVVSFVLDTVRNAGSSPCPPIVVGVGIGGTMEKAAELSKEALLRDIRVRNSDEFYSLIELELLSRINELNIGPQGFGGRNTALAVNIEVYPTHIAGLPVAVNIGCHVTRHREAIL